MYILYSISDGFNKSFQGLEYLEGSFLVEMFLQCQWLEV